MNLFQQIEEVVPTIPGWCVTPKALALASAVVALRPIVTYELGVYGGRGTIALALAHKFINHGKVVAIDAWSNEAAVEGYTEKHVKWWGEQPMEALYRHFMADVRRLELEPFVEVVRARSDDVCPPQSSHPMIGHIDGQHSMQALVDTRRFCEVMPRGSLVFQDDLKWEGGGPAAAVDWMLHNGWIKLYDMDTGGMFQRIE